MEILFTAIAALLGTLVLIPWLGAVAPALRLVDHPDENRKLHRQPIPLVGGIAIFLATALALVATFWAWNRWLPGWEGWNLDLSLGPDDIRELWGLGLGCGFLLLVGALDDKYGIRGRQKLLGQIIACSFLVFAGFQFDYLELYGWKLEFGSFKKIVAYLWLLGAINSVNLLDGADGFAGTVGAIMAVAFCVMSLFTGNPIDALITAALFGAIVGFLKYNLPPARVYLGDAGSMVIGLLFGALAIRCTFKQASAYAFLGPLALLTIPLFDTTAAILRRRLTGRSIYAVDRAHLHHTLAGHGFGPTRSLLLVAALCSISSLGGVMTILTKQSEWAVISMGIVVAFLVSSRIFGFAEFQLLCTRLSSLARSFWSIGRPAQGTSHHSAVQLQGIRDWELIWQNVREFAEKHDFKTLKLHLHLPWLHEIFHAQYKKMGADLVEKQNEWYYSGPLVAQNRIIGEIEVVGLGSNEESPYEAIARLIELLEDLEPMFVEVMESIDTQDSPEAAIPAANPIDTPELAPEPSAESQVAAAQSSPRPPGLKRSTAAPLLNR